MRTKNNLLTHELIGLIAEIKDSSNNQITGLVGKIVDETKSMLMIETSKGVKMIPKKESNWKFFLSNNDDCIVSGYLIAKRPHERLVTRL